MPYLGQLLGQVLTRPSLPRHPQGRLLRYILIFRSILPPAMVRTARLKPAELADLAPFAKDLLLGAPYFDSQPPPTPAP